MAQIASAMVQRALRTAGEDAVTELARRNRGPIIEPTNDPSIFAVTFVFSDRTGEIDSVGLFCPAIPQGFDTLQRLSGRVFAGTLHIPAGTRVKYHYCPNPP